MPRIFEKRIAYKPYEYPTYSNDAWFPQSYAHWLHTKIPMKPDVKDWKENLKPHEKNLVGNILLGFAQTECAVGDYWTGQVVKWFPKWEIQEMAKAFGYFETIHAKAYSYLNEELGLDNFEAFLHEPAVADKWEALMQTKADYTHEELAKDPRAREDVARSLAIFSAFAEGVSLYSSFAVLYSFQMRNLLKGIGQQMKWSVRDESLHSKMGCQLFNHICEEYPELREDVKQKIYEAADLTLRLEEGFIDKMFEQGDLENLKSSDLKEFIKKRINQKLEELGYESKYEYNPEMASELDWFYHLTGGVEHADFFVTRPTDYSVESIEDNFDDMWD